MTLSEELREEQHDALEAPSLRAALGRKDDEIRTLRQQLGLLEQLDKAVVKTPKWTTRKRGGKGKHGIVVAQLTDTHFDEVVRPEEVDFINAYNPTIAEMRLRRWADKTIVLARDYVTGVELDGVTVLATGDILSGDIHEELKETNAHSLYEGVLHWGPLLEAAIRQLADEFGRVHVAAVVGNHGRNSRKPRFKKRATNNIEWLLWRFVARQFKGDTRVSFQVEEAMDATVPIYSTNYLITHGDQFRGGSGISGAMSPLMLGLHRKTQRQAVTDRPMDIMVMGHFHQYLTLPGLIVGGSMKGYDEYAYGGNFRPEPARQAFWVTTPEHGPTITAPLLLQDREAEGW